MNTLPGVGQTPSLLIDTAQSSVQFSLQSSVPTEAVQTGPGPLAPITGASAATQPVYEAFILPRLSLTSLGLGQPQNFGDVSALLSFVSLTLEQTVGENRKQDAITRGEKVRTGLNNTRSIFSSMQVLRQALSDLSIEREGKEALRTEKANARAGLEADRADLVSERTPLQAQSDALQGDINSAQAQIASLNATLASETDPAVIESLNAQLAELNAVTTESIAQKAIVDTQIVSLTSQINSLTNGIDTLESEISTLDAEIEALVAEEAKALAAYFQFQVLIFFFMFNFKLGLLHNFNKIERVEVVRDALIEEESEEIFVTLKQFDIADHDLQMIREIVNDAIIEPNLLDELVKTAAALFAAILEALSALSDLADMAPLDLEADARGDRSRMQISVR